MANTASATYRVERYGVFWRIIDLDTRQEWTVRTAQSLVLILSGKELPPQKQKITSTFETVDEFLSRGGKITQCKYPTTVQPAQSEWTKINAKKKKKTTNPVLVKLDINTIP